MTYAIVLVIVLILDQAIKFWTNSSLAVGETARFIPGLVELTNYQNTGMAWGMLDNKLWARWLFVVLSVLFFAAIIYMLSSKLIKGKLGRWTILLVMAGGMGNCIDRVVKGYVVDMFHFQFWESFPVFNIADMFISVSGIIFCAWLFFHKSEKEEKPLAAHEAHSKRGPERRAPEHRETAPVRRQGGDYITQLKKPVVAAKAELEQERARADFEARELAKQRAARDYQRQYAQPSPDRGAPDPFADFVSSDELPTPAPRRAPAEGQRDERNLARNSARDFEKSFEPEKQPAFDNAPAKKRSDTDFTLEDILAEFSDK